MPVEITSVADLVSSIDLVSYEEPAYMFRGESKPYDSPCTPLLFRTFDSGDTEFDGGVGQEMLRIKRWREEVELSEGKFLSAKSDLEAMILARHYGVHTRLLDWSLNPLVSCYFSVNGHDDEKGCIYTQQNMSLSLEFTSEISEGKTISDRRNALEKNPFCREIPAYLENDSEGLRPFKKVHFFQPRSLPDARILAQSGVISTHPNLGSGEQFEPHLAYEIPAERKKHIRRELSVLGFDERSLGLSTRDGIAKRLNNLSYPW